MKKRYLVIILAIISLCSCTGSKISKPLEFEAPQFPETSELTYSILNDTSEFYRPWQIIVYDSVLIFKDDLNRDECFHIFHKEKGHFMKSFCSKGKGASEAIYPNELTIDQDKAITFDMNLQKMIVFNLPKILSNEEDYYKVMGRDVMNKTILDNDYMTSFNGGYLLFHRNENHRFMFTNLKDTNLEKLYSIYPNVINEDWEATSGVLSYAARMALSPDQTKFVSLTFVGGIGETFDVKENTMVARSIKGFHKPIYRMLGGVPANISSTKETIFGFDGVVATNDFIYAIYRGERPNKEEKGKIAVFDWDLNPVKLYTFDGKLYCFTKDEVTGDAYGIVSQDETYKIVRFNDKFLN